MGMMVYTPYYGVLPDLDHQQHHPETPKALTSQRPGSSGIMLGLVGHPNVGKSSMVNSLMGGKARREIV